MKQPQSGKIDRLLKRRAIAWLAHAPGLWLVYREIPPRRLLWANAIAVVVTLILIVTAYLAGGENRVLFAFGAWVLGHIAWGTYLAWKLPP